MPQETESRPSLPTALTPALYRSADWQNPALEPTIDEILSDPIVHLVLGRDHLEIGDVERFLKNASRRLVEKTKSQRAARAKVTADAEMCCL